MNWNTLQAPFKNSNKIILMKLLNNIMILFKMMKIINFQKKRSKIK